MGKKKTFHVNEGRLFLKTIRESKDVLRRFCFGERPGSLLSRFGEGSRPLVGNPKKKRASPFLKSEKAHHPLG